MPRSLIRSGSRGFRSYWLIIIVLIFFISAMVSLVQLRQSINILDERYGTSVWSLFQLKSEMRRFHDTLSIYSRDTQVIEEVQHRYDILWSRFPVLLQGEDAVQVQKIKGAPELIGTLFTQIKTLEPIIFEELESNPALAKTIQSKLEKHFSALEKLAVANYHFNNDFYNRGDGKVSQLQQQLIFLMIGLIISGSLLMIMLLRENKQNRFQAEHDSLTSMPNRTFLKDELIALCNQNKRFALHMIDLNGFKDVNDTLGHHTGDQLLRGVSNRLFELIDDRHHCLTCRLGGDEFAIIQYPLNQEREIALVGSRIIEALEDEFIIHGHTCHVGASVGTVIYPTHGDDASTLLSRADLAMYSAKEHSPESRHEIFEIQLDEQVNRRQNLQRDLREAIEHNQLHLEYQPIVNLPDNSISYFEALLRWHHPEIGPIPPLEVIEIAEQYGLANQLGHWVIDGACRQLKEWQSLDIPQVPVSINISPSMYRMDLVMGIRETLKHYQLDKGSLSIEITEDTSMKIIKEAGELLPALKRIGVTAALDDFGTGLSSLSHLQQLEVQTLKIDRSFVSDIVENKTSSALIKNIIGIGHDLGMKVVAEGIECPKSAILLASYGCDLGQGYLFSRPQPGQQAAELHEKLFTEHAPALEDQFRTKSNG